MAGWSEVAWVPTPFRIAIGGYAALAGSVVVNNFAEAGTLHEPLIRRWHRVSPGGQQPIALQEIDLSMSRASH
ncbi:MAG: hypothetical protein KJZ78_21705, partial [Bryobacteraceae bacterium]|nr:hypothetical protein [Bryobacteraceae bacterium]